jgi:tripeptidyl-peptidase I
MFSAITCHVLVILLLFVTASIASDLPNRSSYAVRDSHRLPRRWARVGPAPAKHLVQLQIGLRQSNFSELQRNLYEGK